MGIKVFFCEPVGKAIVRLRVYEDGVCPHDGGSSYHSASSDRVAEFDHPSEKSLTIRSGEGEYAGHPSWPAACACGHVFSEAASRQVRPCQLVQRTDTGELFEGYRRLPAGAVWNAFWMADGRRRTGDDGRCLTCKLPDGHDWMIDSRASNCTMPDDDVHKCWVRHGRPEDGDLHVDKNGNTCAAGAGSIATPKWHGFLHDGELRAC